MTATERITALEARIAALEMRLATVEARPYPQTVPIPAPGPAPYQPPFYVSSPNTWCQTSGPKDLPMPVND